MTCSPIPSHPSNEVLLETISSVKRFCGVSNWPIILAHDAPRPRTAAQTIRSYEEYLASARRDIPSARVFCLEHWGHTSGLIRAVVDEISTEMVLVVQQDMPFVRPVNILGAVDVLRRNQGPRHIRFNLRSNLPSGWDSAGHSLLGFRSSRSNFFKETCYASSHGKLRMVRTLAWSENNYLTTTRYLKGVVIPLSAKTNSLESGLNSLGSPHRHSVLGTFVYGAHGSEPAIKHLDGRNLKSAPSSRQVSELHTPAQNRFRNRFHEREAPRWMLSGAISRLGARYRWCVWLRRNGSEQTTGLQ